MSSSVNLLCPFDLKHEHSHKYSMPAQCWQFVKCADQLVVKRQDHHSVLRYIFMDPDPN
jgi:hypothetical protein